VGGKYSNTAVGQGRQFPFNSPLYDGTQQNWVKEEIDLIQFARKQIKIRFSVLSDEYVQKDGWYLDDISIVTYDDITSLDEVSTPLNFSLSQNYPNPFNPSTVISYQLAVGSLVSLKVFDVLGNEVATLVNAEKAPGEYQVSFNTQLTTNHQPLSSGVYFYQLKAAEFMETKKMILLR